MESSVVTFLRDRQVERRIIEVFINEKIDITTVKTLDDQALAKYLPALGDRVALRNFCDKEPVDREHGQRKMSLLETLKKKMKLKNQTTVEESSSDAEGPSHACSRPKKRKADKKLRMIELSWVHEAKTVRAIHGGGTRKFPVSNDTGYSDLLKIGKELFFPDGKSPKGPEADFTFKIMDFKMAEMHTNETVGQICYKAKMGPRLRFYVSTSKSIHCSSGEESDTEDYHLEQSVTNAKQGGKPDDHNYVDINRESLASSEEGNLSDPPTYSISDIDEDDVVQFGPVHDEEYASEATLRLSESPTGTPVTSPNLVNPYLLNITLKLHRVTVLEEMISHFKDTNIITYPLSFTFIDEKGADAQGVSRDAYSAFWTIFFDVAAEGEDMRVPLLSPKWQEEEWRAIGRILAKGFKDVGYFPTRLAPAFTVALVFGEHAVSPDLLYSSLMQYFSQTERNLLSLALEKELSGDDKDDLIDLMDRVGVTTIPTSDNLKPILLQVAHKQLIQQPKYALDNLAEGAGQILKDSFTSQSELLRIYDDKNPTTRKMLQLIKATPNTSSENQSFQFFKQYVRAQDEAGLRRLLRYVTGSDVVCVPEIQIVFTSLEGLARRPVAHTCGSVLELPETYTSYAELRSEFESILSDKSCFIMDIA